MSAPLVLTMPFRPPSEFAPDRSPRRPSPPRRRLTPQQGRALEALGHAIEYLVDSRLFEQWESPADAAAVQLLMTCSRQVYADCEEILPWTQRVQRTLMKRLHLQNANMR